MLASIISSKQKQSKMLAFPINYYGLIFKATQSVELFCAYDLDSRFDSMLQRLKTYNDKINHDH